MKRCFLAASLFALCACSTAQTTWYKFSKQFINSHYSSDSAIGQLQANLVSPAKSVHTISCGGNDGELHIGVAGADIANAGDQTVSASVVDDNSDFGIVAEPVNLAAATKRAAQALDGEKVSFTGYYRAWNEGHDSDSGHASNPAHVLELHPAWSFHSSDQDFDDPSSIRPMRTAGGTPFRGYGASKFRPLFADLDQEGWLHVYEDDDFVYVELEKASNFYQLPVAVKDVHDVTGGVSKQRSMCSRTEDITIWLPPISMWWQMMVVISLGSYKMEAPSNSSWAYSV